MVDSGSQVSVLSRRAYAKIANKKNLLSLKNVSFLNADGSELKMDGWISAIPVEYKNRKAQVDFLVGSVPDTILGLDSIAGLDLQLKKVKPAVAKVCEIKTTVEHREKSDSGVVLAVKPDAPSECIQKARRLPFALQN